MVLARPVALLPAGLHALLARREAWLAARERAAVAAALSEAPPELRAELVRRLGRAQNVRRDGARPGR